MRLVIPFNHDWLFYPQPVGLETPPSAFSWVTLPHTNKLFPHHNFDDADYQFISTYRKVFTLPQPRRGRRVFLDFEGAMLAATVTINDHTFPEHKGGFTPFSYDITDYLHDDDENLLTVHLDSRERADIPPFGHTVDYMVFGGIYREVQLRYVDLARIEGVFVYAHEVLTDAPKLQIDVDVWNQRDQEFAGVVKATIYDGDQVIKTLLQSTTLAAGERVNVSLSEICQGATWESLQLWTLDQPHLYRIVIEFGDDQISTHFGFREAQFRNDGFYLNGKPLKLFGLNRHQNYPYIGAAAPARLQRKDAEILKYELGCNIVRTSHYPQSRHFLDRCDEIGLLVFEEIPGWQHIGDSDWQNLSLRDVKAMIERDRNHPSIIIWGVRINESFDEPDFYTKTNALARSLDPTRPTGGVRFFLGGDFLEDVYTFNDFSNGILEPDHTPHLVTEFNGHMFPTKSYDNEERLVEHALRHARIQSLQMSTGGVAGAIGWCAFDYNTHKEFGAGDRICYHGVMDIFRLPKHAAYFYASQQAPSQRVILHAATTWKLGDLKEGVIEPIYVFSNCDRIEVFIGGVQQLAQYTRDVQQFPNLPYAPFKLMNLGVLLAHPYGELRIVGYLNDQAVAECCITQDAFPQRLTLQADDAVIQADGIDMTRIVFKITDDYGTPLPYTHTVVTFEVEGEADLIGENPFALVGGQAAVYLKARFTPGPVRVRAKTPYHALAEVLIVLQA
ncbi:MAG: glycoside hydrolase family 2 protein [Anaerolineae bacterium]|nr:glycoside hydrolase family 2 protein [Anaerolineae bacterium]